MIDQLKDDEDEEREKERKGSPSKSERVESERVREKVSESWMTSGDEIWNDYENDDCWVVIVHLFNKWKWIFFFTFSSYSFFLAWEREKKINEWGEREGMEREREKEKEKKDERIVRSIE